MTPEEARAHLATRANQARKISNALLFCAWLLWVAAVLAGSWRIAGVGFLILLPAGVLALGSYAIRQKLAEAKEQTR